MSWDREISDIEQKRALDKELGGEEGVARQHVQGRQTIRERIDGLLDTNALL